MKIYVFEDPNVMDSFEVEADSLEEATTKFLDGYDTLDGGKWEQISVKDSSGDYIASLTIYPNGKGGIESRNLVTVI